MSGLRHWERTHIARETARVQPRRQPMLKGRVFLFAGLIAAAVLGMMVVRLIAGLATSEKPTPIGQFDIPGFGELLACNAHYSHEILRIKNRMPAHNTKADLPRLHRDYRRLHRLLRQVGRRDGIAPAVQTSRLRAQVQELHREPGKAGAEARDGVCRAMASLPIARNRKSQLIVGQ